MVLFAEHHPLPETEERALEQINRAFPDTPEVVYYCSLDDAFMKAFLADRIKPMLARLGVKEDENLGSGWTALAIRRAQKKMASEVTFEIKASSAGEWFERNYPDPLSEP